jgi:hypothetical protein
LHLLFKNPLIVINGFFIAMAIKVNFLSSWSNFYKHTYEFISKDYGGHEIGYEK